MAPSPSSSQTTTVFVRFIPPSVNIRRHHLEDVFSQIGPIKKSSIILPAAASSSTHNNKKNPNSEAATTASAADDTTTAIAASSYGFVKYTTELDAQRAAEKLNHSSLKISATETVTLKVERASRVNTAKTTTTTGAGAASKKDKSVASAASAASGGGRRSHDDDNDNDNETKKKTKHVDGDHDVKNKKFKTTKSATRLVEQQEQQQQQQDGHDEENLVVDDDVKKTNRLIIRNLSFYAKKNHIRTALESRFGPILDIHIPTVLANNNNDEKSSNNNTAAAATTAAPTTHRGFCFVTFVNAKDAQDCLAAAEAASASSSSADGNNKAAAPPILIAKRPVSIARALNKTAFEHQKQQQKKSTSSTSAKNIIKDGVEQSKTANANAEKDDEEEDEGSDSDDDSSDSNSSSRNDGSDRGDKMKGSSDDDGESSDSEEESASNDDDDDDDDDVASKDSKQDRASKVNAVKDEKALGEKRTLFLRNLPFDATRHDLFQLFYKFGYITGIYLVKDKETGIPKGTAFVTFRDAHATERALQAADAAAPSTSTEQGQQRDEQQQHQADFSTVNSSSANAGGLLLNGRRIFVNLAVDKETAFTLTMDQKNANSSETTKSDGAAAGTKDRRNLYLKGEGRVDNTTDDNGHESKAWDELPESDQLKRQRAWSEKNSKLRSPLFFINPTRLSIRNLAKDVNEVALKRLCVEALQRGLENKLVTAQDQIGHWKASGELSTRDILKRVESQPDEQDVIPKFDEENVRKSITSVYVDCEIGKNKKEKISRGFGFVEFEHHAHALACLRELNNNTRYTQEYAIGGKHAVMTRTRQRKSSLSASKKAKRDLKNDGDDQQVKLPRLIVEFTVENIAKAKQQAEHRALQQSNLMKQKRENREKGSADSSKTKEKKKSRGQRQREKKRQRSEAGDDDNEAEYAAVNETAATTRKQQQQQQHANYRGESNKASNNDKVKKVKPPKRQKVDPDEVEFSKLVASYKNSFTADAYANEVANDGENHDKEKKRWFE